MTTVKALAATHTLICLFALLLVLPLLSVQTDGDGIRVSGRNDAVTILFNYAGAEALLDVFDRTLFTDADIAKLLDIRGVSAMVDNVARYTPVYDRARFGVELRDFGQTQKTFTSPFAFDRVFRTRQETRTLITTLRANETTLIRELQTRLEPYRPPIGPLTVTGYFVVGGSSDGFVLDRDDEPAFFVALDVANGDVIGVRLNMAHELYHVMQKAAAKHVTNLAAIVRDPTQLSPPERLLATTLWEGSATFAADALKFEGTGPDIDVWHSRAKRNAEPARIKENFALFDTTLADLRAGHVTWDDVQKIGFSGNNDARFYAVGYEMAKSIEHYRGAGRIGELFEQSPYAFFWEYISRYRKHPEISARFASATEAYCENLR